MDTSFRETNAGVGNFWFFEKGLSDEMVDTFRASLSDDALNDGTVGDEGVVLTSMRRAKCIFIEPSRFCDVFTTVKSLIATANSSYFNFDLFDMAEGIQYTEYHASDKGFYDWHMDVGGGTKSRRKLSIVVQLSDPSEYDGGELQMHTEARDPVTIGKDKGLAVVFPSYLLHRVTPVTRGVRRSLVAWVDGPPFR